MNSMQQKNILALGPSGFHRVAYTQWGESHNKNVVICVHGLTRHARDFDFLAANLEDRFRVICPDIVGRGESDRLSDPYGYDFTQYSADMAALIARTGAGKVSWVGTSMGGLIGMFLAAQPQSPIKAMVINDIGPFIPKEGIQRIAEVVGTDPQFSTIEGAENYLRTVSAGFGPLTDAQWRHLAVHGTKPGTEGRLRLHYDPAIAIPFKENADNDVDLWDLWDKINCPVLILRGAGSDVLKKETAIEMVARKPGTEIVEFADVGHAPMIMDLDQIEPVRNWLLEHA